MKRIFAILICLILVTPILVFAQTPKERIDLEFVDGLRKRGDLDLALDYLKLLDKIASKELKSNIPLEIARTQLSKAIAEPDKTRRQKLYLSVMVEIKKFIADNPKSSRVSEAKLDLANLSIQMAKGKISEISLMRTNDDKVAKGNEAKALILDSRNQMKSALKEMADKLATLTGVTPAEIAESKSLSDKIAIGEMDLALSFYDEAKSVVDTGKDKDRVLRGNIISEAIKAMEKLTDRGESDSQTWKAKAWIALFLMENGEPKKARPKLIEILTVSPINKAANDAKRLARYFFLQVIKDAPDPTEKDVDKIIQTNSNKWLEDYKAYVKTPEGYGIRMLLAKSYIEQFKSKAVATNPQKKAELLNLARKQLTEVEQAENEFTDEARNLKISLMKEQGAFTKKVSDLKSFEDCFTRAQYEISLILAEEAKNTNPDDLEKKRKEHAATIIASLKQGLETKEAKETIKKGSGQNQYEVNNARAMLAFYYFNEKQFDDAITVGKQFVIDDPRSSQAATASLYTLGSFTQKLAELEKSGATEDKVKSAQSDMALFAKMMMERWPSDTPGDSARHQLAMFMVKDKKYAEAVATLEKVNPSYQGFPFCMYELGNAALAAEGELKDGKNRLKAIKALESIPLPEEGSDSSLNKVYFIAKAKLGGEYYLAKRFVDLQNLSAGLSAELAKPNNRLDMDQVKDDEIRKAISNNVGNLGLFALYGLSNASFSQSKLADVSKLLDPLVDKASEGKMPEIKQNLQLGSALLGMALQANISIGDIEKSRKVVKALQYLSSDAEASGTANVVLLQLNSLIGEQIRELRKKGDAKNLDVAIKGFTIILDDVTKEDTTKKKAMTNDLVRLISINYSTMGLNEKALDLLKKAEKPKDANDTKGISVYKGIQLQQARELRYLKKFDDAIKLIEEIIGTKEMPGWGNKDIDCLLEKVKLVESQEKFSLSSSMASQIVKALVGKSSDNQIKEKYLEAYYHMVYGLYKYGDTSKDTTKAAKGLLDAAGLIEKLESSQPDFGSIDSKKRFVDLFATETKLKDAFEALKAKRAASGSKTDAGKTGDKK